MSCDRTARCWPIPDLRLVFVRRLDAEFIIAIVLSAFKRQKHDTVQFGQLDRLGDKGERTVGQSFFLRLREQTP